MCYSVLSEYALSEDGQYSKIVSKIMMAKTMCVWNDVNDVNDLT